MNVEKLVRDPNCQDCKLHQTADIVCEVGYGQAPARVMVVGKIPNSGKYQTLLETELDQAGLDVDKIYWASALKCKTFEQDASNLDVKTCRQYLNHEIELVKPQWILALGNEALLATTGHSGITKYRGKPIEKNGYKVVPTLSPASVQRSPGMEQGWRADLRFFAFQVDGKKPPLAEPPMSIIDNNDKLRKLKKLLDKADLIAYDLETTMNSEFAEDAAIVSMAGTVVYQKDGREKIHTWTLPLSHPQSVWRKCWPQVLHRLAPHLERIPKQVAHNGKFDARWLRAYGVNMKVTFDTMLAAHLLDENRQKGLKPLGQMFFGVAPWGIDTKTLASQPINGVLKYNGLDTYYTYHLYLELKRQLIVRPRLARIFKNLLMPANEIFIEVERRGIWVDQQKLSEANKIAFDMRDSIDRELMEWVPDPEVENVLEMGWPTMGKRKKLAAVNFNASNFARWWLFEYLKFPVIEVGKTKQDGSEGDPSMKEAVLLELKRQTQHPVVLLLLERTKWQKYCTNYVNRYQELRDANGRLHTSFKLAGTVTGRLSSGKEDAEKLTGRTRERGVNLQQVPRDTFIRGLFGAPEGSLFVEADFSQIELRIIAWLAREKTMLQIYQQGEDIHKATASWIMGKPSSQLTSEDRKKAKAINFGFCYGMGANKFVSTAFEKYELVFSVDEARAIRKQYFSLYSGLLPWHARQRRLVNEHARVQSPLGRIRHLPNIRSPEQSVAAEAERQAINSPVQSMASDMALLAMVLIDKQVKERGLDVQILGTVHDSINFEIRENDVEEVLPIVKHTMENLPLKRKFGVEIAVPIIADLSVGRYWGQGNKVDEDYNWEG